MCLNYLVQDESLEGTEYKSTDELRWETAATKITNEAVRSLTADNVTVVLIKISPPTMEENKDLAPQVSEEKS